MPDDRVVALALTTLSMSHEGVFLVGLTSTHLDTANNTGLTLRLYEIVHLYVKQSEDDQIHNVFIEPVLGFDEAYVNLTSYTAYGYLTGELLEKYQAWSSARKAGFPEVEEPELPTS